MLELPHALLEPASWPRASEVQLRETHASWVFLAGDFAYKVKKAVRMAFLDYSTLALRRAACEEEVRVNRELAPDVYLDVRAIVLGRDGRPRLAPGSDRGAVEYAVRMRRFDERLTLEHALPAGRARRAVLDAVARRIADFHAGAARARGGEPQLLGQWRENVSEIGGARHPAGWQLAPLESFGEAFVAAHGAEIARRARSGLVRDGHGDLRCEHVLPGPPVRIVDRIEFDPARRRMDVGRDLAFLAMDLEAHGRPRAARELIAGYRRAGGSPGGEQLRCFHAAHWALVRAKVALIAAESLHGPDRQRARARAQRLWQLAERLCWRARRPLALIVCGTPASGKSTLASELARRSGMRVLASDAVRKRLAGLRPTERAAQAHYTPAFTRATYERLAQEAAAELERRGGVIVDATCRERSTRRPLLRSLAADGAGLLAVRCEVPLETALARARSRSGTSGRVSDATPEVVAEQFSSFEPLTELPRSRVLALDAELTLDAQRCAVLATLDGLLARA